MALTLRTVKGSPLTYQEMDDNLTYLSSSISGSGGGSGVGFPFTGSAQITGSLGVIGPVSITGSAVPNGYGFIYASGADNASKTLTTIDGFYKNSTRPIIETNVKLGAIDLSLLGTGVTGYSKGLVLPTSIPLDPVNGSIYWDGSSLQVYNGSIWVSIP